MSSQVAKAVRTRQGEPVQYLEASDVARVLELSYSGVYAIVQSGVLKPAGVTMRGVRLFLADEVAALKAARDSRRGKGGNDSSSS